MSTRAYFIGGPLDGHANDFKTRMPNKITHRSSQQELLGGMPESTDYEKTYLLDDDGSSVIFYVPEGKQATAFRAMLETRLKEKNDG